MAVSEPLPDTGVITPPQESQGASAVRQTPGALIAHDLLINVLGTKFSITAGEDPEYLNEVLAQYRFAVANTQSISGMKDPLQVAILTGFLLCDEINKLRLQVEEDQAGAEKEISRVMNSLAARIDQMLIQEIQPVND